MQVRVERKEFQYLYSDGDGYVCMDEETFDQITVPAETIGEGRQYQRK